MKTQYDDPMFEAHNGGAAAWLVAWPVLLLFAVISLLMLNIRRTLACLLMVAAYFSGTGCRSPLIEVNRNGPLISSEIQINDSANNNEIPLLK